MAVVRTVWCRTSFIGFHCWPEAPSEVAHLRNAHRHVFGVEVHVLVTHDNRDVEFQLLKKSVDRLIENTFGDLREPVVSSPASNVFAMQVPSYSCEKIAETISLILNQLGYHVTQVTVDEDGENGATISYGA